MSALAISPVAIRWLRDERRGLWILDLASGQWSEISTSFSPVATRTELWGWNGIPSPAGNRRFFFFLGRYGSDLGSCQKVPRMLLNSHQGPVLALGFAPRNKGHRPLLLSADEGSCIHLWDQGTYNLLACPWKSPPAKFMAVSPDGNQVAWADNSRHLHVSHLDSLERSSTEIIPFDPADPRSLRNDLVLDQESHQLIHRQSDGDVRLLPVDQDPASPFLLPWISRVPRRPPWQRYLVRDGFGWQQVAMPLFGIRRPKQSGGPNSRVKKRPGKKAGRWFRFWNPGSDGDIACPE